MFSINVRLTSIAREGLFYCFVLVLVIPLTLKTAQAQTVTTTTSITDGRTPSGLQPGSPAGSYPLSGFDNVNMYNGNLNVRFPLAQVGGRGSAHMAITLALNLKSWRIKHTHKVMPDGNELDSYVPTQTGWRPYSGYGAGSVTGRHYGLQTSNNISCRWYSKTLSRITFSTSDGTEYELRDQSTNGQPLSSSCTQGAARGTVFVTADGSAATFISDTAIFDQPAVNSFGPQGFSVSGFLLLKDGTRYRVDSGSITWIRDRNGNKISFTYSTGSMTITDQLNRTITVTYDVSDVAPYGLCDRITFKGFGGAQRTLRVSKTNLGNALRPNSGYSIRTLGGPSGLFPETNGSSSTYHDPSVTSAVWLPDGRSYKFYYNSYGELARVELPTSGAYEYDMTPGSGVICLNFCWPDDQREIYRRVVERRVYSNGSTGSAFEHKEVYTNTEAVGSNTSTVTVEKVGPTGTVLERDRHYFDGSALSSLFGGAVSYAYPAWYEGNENQTDALHTAGDIASATVLRRTITSRQQRQSVSWWPSHASTNGLDINKEPPNDPRVTEVVTTVEPATTNLVSKQVYGYDDTVPFNNQNNLKEYGFGTGSPGSLMRETQTTFLTSSTYTGTNVHIRNLPLQVSTYQGVTERARSTIEYDNYNADSYHAALVSRASVSGFDPAFSASYTTRGNATASTGYLLVNGSITGSVSSYTQYDIVGNTVKQIDPRSTPSNVIATTVEYDDRYGSPDSEARANTAPSELTALTSFAFPTRIINPLGHTNYIQYDYYIGTPVNGEDTNGVISAGYFNDLLERPTQIRLAVGTSAENQTTFAYDDPNRTVTTSRDRDANNDNLLVNKVLFDQLARIIESRQYEGGTNYIATKIEYDALGRAYKKSNPFRPWKSETAVWSTQGFDALGRAISFTTPDGASRSTNYVGNTVTTTDPAGKANKTVNDALGRMIQAYEDPNNLNYLTTYVYDVLDNLVGITQGSQQRFFMYDSLKRVIRSRNPEQATNSSLNLTEPITGNSSWSIGYQYDASGNVTQRTDARGIVSTYTYDALGRNTVIDYSDTTPDVTRQFDLAIKGVGRLNQTSQSGTTNSATYIDSYDELGRPLIQRQRYQTAGVWSASYQTQRLYNRAGSVTSQTYPSGRTVTYSYDAAGRATSVAGTLGDNLQRTYATGITYSPWGSLGSEQFGTNAAVYNKRKYNIRGQLFDTRVSSVNDDWGGELGALVNYYSTNWIHGGSGTDNNGDVLMSQTIINSFYVEDRYTYDTLNRLTAVNEYQNGSTPTGSQQYVYDRWGNRTINPASWGTGINAQQFSVDPATNRLGVPVGQSGTMTYDSSGNLTTDTYSGSGSRVYDAENKMSAAQDSYAGWSYYTYDGDGRRTRRKINGQETWQIYGFDAELVAEYPAGGATTTPQKEYGYRNGELLVTTGDAGCNAGFIGTKSWAATNGSLGHLTGQQEGADWAAYVSTHSAQAMVYGPYDTSFGNGHHQAQFQLQVDNTSGTDVVATLDVVVGYGTVLLAQRQIRRNEFTAANTWQWFTLDFDHPCFGAVEARVYWQDTTNMKFREVKISSAGGGAIVNWIVSDHLRTPRMIFDQSGSIGTIKRRDYLPFGEELLAGAGGRTTGMGYAGGSIVRQQFTSQERDTETGLDYFLARYYSSKQGRFTSVDPANTVPIKLDPQSLNGYAHARNNPLLYVDPDGLLFKIRHADGTEEIVTDEQFNEIKYNPANKDLGVVVKDGKIYNTDENGNQVVVATYERIWFDDLTADANYVIWGIAARAPAMQTIILAFAAANLLPAAGIVVADAAAGAIAYMGEQAFVRALAKLSLDELKSVYAGTQRELLSQLWGQGVQGARVALSSGRIPAGLTREAMLAYAEIARRYIEAGRDTTGVQALRLQVIKQALEKLK